MMARRDLVPSHRITEDWGVDVDGDRLRFVLAGMLMGCGEIVASSAAALRALADECERAVPPVSAPAAPAVRDLFEGAAE